MRKKKDRRPPLFLSYVWTYVPLGRVRVVRLLCVMTHHRLRLAQTLGAQARRYSLSVKSNKSGGGKKSYSLETDRGFEPPVP